jgi:multidrug resistance efflux pump
MLSSNDIDHLATKDDLHALRAELKGDIVGVQAGIDGLRAELKADIAELRAEMRDVLYQQTRTQVTWMFGLLGAYTAMAGSFVAFGTFIIAS